MTLITNLEGYDRLNAHNYELYTAYRQGVSGVEGVRMLLPDEKEEHNYHYAVLNINDDASIRRDTLHRILVAENVYVRRYFRPGCHRSPPYNSSLNNEKFPVTDQLSMMLLQLPTGLQMDLEKAACLAALIRFCFNNGVDIESRLNA